MASLKQPSELIIQLLMCARAHCWLAAQWVGPGMGAQRLVLWDRSQRHGGQLAVLIPMGFLISFFT